MIIAIDPGGTTGIAKYQSEVWPIVPHLVTTGNVTRGLIGMMDWLASASPSIEGVTFVVEEYRIYKDKAKEHIGSDVETIQIIGAIKYAIHLWQREGMAVEMYVQSAAIQLNWPVEKLKAFGLKTTGRSSHEISALCHLVQYLVVQKNQNRRR